MQLFLEQTLNGLTFAGLLFLLGSGFGISFGLLRVANIAHGSAFLLGGYIGYSTLKSTGSFWLAIPAGALAMGVAGIVLERLLRVMRGEEMGKFLLTIGISIIGADIALVLWGGDPVSIQLPGMLNESFTIGTFVYPWARIFILGVALVIALGLWLLLSRTRIGAIIRAGVDNREMVGALGIDVSRLFMFVFALGMLLAGLAGVLSGSGSMLSIAPGNDNEILTFIFAIVIIGGRGTLAGPVVGSLVVGLTTTYGAAYLPELSYFSLFVPMALILLWRPQGLFGRAEEV
jgi:branched-chain amino acid transport system permease protein